MPGRMTTPTTRAARHPLPHPTPSPHDLAARPNE